MSLFKMCNRVPHSALVEAGGVCWVNEHARFLGMDELAGSGAWFEAVGAGAELIQLPRCH
jgi:hypothetical protein